MEIGTREIVLGLTRQLRSLKDLPRVVMALWSFGLTDDQRELAKQSLRAYVLSRFASNTTRRNQEEIDRILNTKQQ